MKCYLLLVFFNLFQSTTQIKSYDYIENIEELNLFIKECLQTLKVSSPNKYYQINGLHIKTDNKGILLNLKLNFRDKNLTLKRSEYKSIFNQFKTRNYYKILVSFYDNTEKEKFLQFKVSFKP